MDKLIQRLFILLASSCEQFLDSVKRCGCQEARYGCWYGCALGRNLSVIANLRDSPLAIHCSIHHCLVHHGYVEI